MTTTQNDIFERARLSRDARFDGRFYVGVTTTGIYCRPVCPANPPRSENVRFFQTAAAASEAGFRPCLRCRPETAPGTPAWMGTSTTVQRALRLIAHGALDTGGIEALSDRLGVTSRHLRRLFKKHLGASPQAVAHTQRLHLAKRLIDDSRLPLSEVAEAAGFGSVRRFNDAFRKSYGRPPRQLRRKATEAGVAHGAPLSATLPCRQPFDWSAMLRYLARRAIPGVEMVTGGVYLRTVRIGDDRGMLEVTWDAQRSLLRLTLPGLPAHSLFGAVEKVRELFDVDAPVDDINAVLSRDRALRRRLERLPGIRVPGAWDGFELAVRTILGQQVSVAGASTQAGKVAARYGMKFDPDSQSRGSAPCCVFPTPERLSHAQLEEVGVIASRAACIRALSRAVVSGEIDFSPAQEPAHFRSRLMSIRGIGPWTAEYLALRVLKDPDAFPASDLGLCKALCDRKDSTQRLTPTELAQRAEDWRPWRGYAAMALWQSMK